MKTIESFAEAAFMLVKINNHMISQKALLLQLVVRSYCDDSYFFNEEAIKNKHSTSRTYSVPGQKLVPRIYD